MSRRSRQGKARRRAERDRRQVTERELKRPGSPDQDPRVVEVQTAPPPGGPCPRDSEEHGFKLCSDAGGGLIAMDPGEAGLGADADLENADPGDFGDLDPDDADLQAVLAGAAGPGEADARVVKPSGDGAGEDEEIFVFGD